MTGKEKSSGFSFMKHVRSGRITKAGIGRKVRVVLVHLFRYTLLICLGFVIITPLLHLLKDAVTEYSILGLKNTQWIPGVASTKSFRLSFQLLDYWKGLLFSLSNTAILAFLQTLCAALAAYSFARMRFKGSSILFGIVIFSIVVPEQSIMLAQYITFKNFDILGLFRFITGKPVSLVGSDISLYLLAATGMGVKGGLFIYILRQNFKQLPISIEEAAFVDGAGFLKTFFTIVLPNSTAALTTVGVLSFLWNYADTYFSSLLTSSSKNLALVFSYSQANMKSAVTDAAKLLPREFANGINSSSPLVWNSVASASSLLVVLPLLILYLIIQKRFVHGVERSGLGGD